MTQTESGARTGFVARFVQNRYVNAIGGAILGGLVGMALASGWEAVTGATSLDDVIAQQKESFATIEASLAQLQGASSPELLSSIANDLRREISAQQRIASRYQSELVSANRDLGVLRKQLLSSQNGYPGGAEFWLGGGDSMRLVGDGNSFAVGQAWGIYADVTIAGASQRIQVGAELPFAADDRECKVIFRQAARPEDQRAGFDVACLGGTAEAG